MNEETEKGEGRIWAPESYEQARQILERLFPYPNKIVTKSDGYEMTPGAWYSTYKESQRFVKGDPNDRIYVLREKTISRCSCPCSLHDEEESLFYVEEERYGEDSIWANTGLIKGIKIQKELASRERYSKYDGARDPSIPYSQERGKLMEYKKESIKKLNWGLVPEAFKDWENWLKLLSETRS